mmetsp:Transcript_27127/g.23994  ORF Transcript_27127/g.23994 Transcript_27127/m.23994 type:complete len:152 (-) Transcript_27127:657-1112(-)
MGIVTKQQLRRGLDRVYMDTENIKEDAPDFEQAIAKFILKLVKDKVLSNQVLLKIPAEIREEMVKNEEFSTYFKDELEVFEREVEIKQKFSELLSFSESADEINQFQNLDHPDIAKPWFIRQAIIVASGQGNNEREKVSQLLKELAAKGEI